VWRNKRFFLSFNGLKNLLSHTVGLYYQKDP